MAASPSQKVALLPVHGMGPVNCDFPKPLEKALRRRLGNRWNEVHFRPIHYQAVLQVNQDRVWRCMQKRNLDWTRLRRLVLFGFSDATGIERNAHCAGSPYSQVQEIIKGQLREIHATTRNPDIPVVVIAQSLGCHLISNYIWDAQKEYRRRGMTVTRGVWADGGSPPVAVGNEG